MAIESVEGKPGEGMSMDTITENVMKGIKAENVSHAKPKVSKKSKAKAVPVTDQEQGALLLAATPAPSALVMMPLSLITTHVQVRTDFNDESLQELAADIAGRGVLQPILLRPNPGYVNFLVIAGERRFRAAKLAGLENIPAIVGEVDNQVVEDMQLAENIQREDLSLKDTAAAIRKIYERCQSVTETATKVRKSKSWVSKHLAASCPELRSMARGILEGGFSEDLEIILILDKLQLADYWECQQLCEKIKKGEAGRQTVRDTYDAAKVKADEAKRMREEESTPEKRMAADLARAEQEVAWRQSREKAEAERMRDPQLLCTLVSRDASIVEEARTVFTEEQNAIMFEHLGKLHASGAEGKDIDTLNGIILMVSSGDYSEIEIAAFVLGMQDNQFNLEYLIRQVTVTLESNQ